MSQLLASEPQSVAGVLDQGFRLFRAGFGRIVGLALVCTVLLAIVQVVQFVSGVAEVPGTPLGVAVPSWFASVALGVVILFNLAYFAVANAMWHRLWSVAHGTGSAGESLRVGARRMLPAIGASLLFAIAVVVAALPAIGATVALLPRGPVLAIAVALLLGLLALYVGTRLMFTFVEVVVRPSGPVESMRRSWTLTAGNFWRVSAITVVIFAVAIVLYLVVVFLAGLGAAALAGSPVAVLLVTLLVISVLLFLVLPYTMAAWVVLWHDLRLRAEGTDLAARIDALPAG